MQEVTEKIADLCLIFDTLDRDNQLLFNEAMGYKINTVELLIAEMQEYAVENFNIDIALETKKQKIISNLLFPTYWDISTRVQNSDAVGLAAIEKDMVNQG